MRFTSLTLEAVEATDTGATEFRFRPARPLPFRSGQAGLLVVPGGGAKPFTIASAEQAPTVNIATEVHSASRFKRALASLQRGDRALMVGPLGLLPRLRASAPNVFVAQGIGVTPFLSMVRSDHAINADLLQVGTPHFFDEMAEGVTRAEHPAYRQQLHDAINSASHRRRDATWWVAGGSGFVRSVSDWIADTGVPQERIHKDAYLGMRRRPHVARPEGSTVQTG